MRWQRQQAGKPSTLGLWVGAALLGGLAGSALWLRLGLPRPGCAFREWTGLPCATCGSTRMVDALLAGDVAGAIGWNPLVFAALAALALWSLTSVLQRAFGLPRWRLVTDRGERRILAAVVVVAVLAGWAFVIGSGV